MKTLIATRKEIKEVNAPPYRVQFPAECYFRDQSETWYYHTAGGLGISTSILLANPNWIPEEIKLLMLIGGYS